MSIENIPNFSRNTIVMTEDFLRSPAYVRLLETRQGPLALSIYNHLRYLNKGLTDGAFVDDSGDDPAKWIPETAENVQKYFPAFTVEEVDEAIGLLRACQLLERYPNRTEVKPFLYSRRRDVYFLEEIVYVGDDDGNLDKFDFRENEGVIDRYGSHWDRIHSYRDSQHDSPKESREQTETDNLAEAGREPDSPAESD